MKSGEEFACRGCIESPLLTLGNNIHLPHDVLAAEGDVLLKLFEVPFQHGPVHAQDYFSATRRLSRNLMVTAASPAAGASDTASHPDAGAAAALPVWWPEWLATRPRLEAWRGTPGPQLPGEENQRSSERGAEAEPPRVS